MKLRSCLFFLSLVVLAGCTPGNQDELNALQRKVDSLAGSHAQALDSLNQMINAQQLVIEQLDGEVKLLEDSLNGLSSGANGNANPSGPVEDHPRGEPWRPGDEIPEFRKQ